jgi:ABC-type lipoprotein release transport system permease subunit
LTVLFFALRNVALQWKRYLLMFIAILLGFSLMTLVHSISFGALETVKGKAARYFSGHVSITGYEKRKSGQALVDAEEIEAYIRKSSLPVAGISPRTIYYKKDASLFFGGQSVVQRRLIGIDFDGEKDILSTLEFKEGSLERMLNYDGLGIFISEAAADILAARVGDGVQLALTTDTGQYNTATLIVQGIFRETGLFGYVAYMNRVDLNRLLVRADSYATDLAVYTKTGVNDKAFVDNLTDYLSPVYEVLPRMFSKGQLSQELTEYDWSRGPVLAPLTLDAHLDEITTIMDAVSLVAWLIQILFMLILMVGILNTYRVLVFERTKEIGTLRAMGMTRNEVRAMFLYEAFFLDIAASAGGFALYYLLKKIIGVINISMLPGAGLFTEQGHMVPRIDPSIALVTVGLMLLAVLMAAAGPADKASKLSPVEAFRVDN